MLHAYVIMPDHFHILISPQESLERAMQNIKGGFSFRAKRELAWKDDIWQPGFSDHRIRDGEDWDRHTDYIRRNPVKAGLCEDPEDYLYLAVQLDPMPQRLKPLRPEQTDGGTEVPPLQPRSNLADDGTEAPPLQPHSHQPLHQHSNLIRKQN